MKISITELRDMVAQAVRRTVAEARKKTREVAPRSEESIQAQRDAQIRGLPGYAHGNVLDMSKPLGKRSRTKKQGAAGMGGWTSEGRRRMREDDTGDAEATQVHPQQGDLDRPSSMLMQVLQRNGVPFDKAQKIVSQFRVNDPAAHDLDDPSELGIEERNEAVRRLVRMIVREEIRVRR
jgi:hypothetical protein